MQSAAAPSPRAVVESHDESKVVLRKVEPSAAEAREELGMRQATKAEFDAVFGDLPTDEEG